MKKIREYFFAFVVTSFFAPQNGYCATAHGRGSATGLLDVIGILGLLALGIYTMSDSKSRRNRMFRLLVFCTLPFLASCATVGQTTMFSAAMGAAAGTGIGIAAEKSAGSALIGAAIGGVLAGGLGYLIHRHSEGSQPSKAEPAMPKNSNNPSITAPEARRVWVEDKYDDGGRVLEEGHFKYIIDKPSVWSR